MASLELFAERMRYWCDVADLGYDQTQRWNVWDGGEADCSSLVIHALQEAGFDTGSANSTHDLSANLTARGWTRLPADISTARVGDILLNDRDHVAAVVYGWGWWATIAEAWLDENGGIYYGQSGDQTALETRTRGIYSFPWDCILRYEGGDDDMQKDELIALPEGGNIECWQTWSWDYHYTKEIYEMLCAGSPLGVLDKDIATQGGGNMPVWQAISWAYTYAKEAAAQIAALTEAVKVLAESKGADPKAIEAAVKKAVAEKLETLTFKAQ